MENINKVNKGHKGATMSVKKLVTIGLLAAIGIVLVYLIRFPFFPVAAPFLEYDPADIPILIGTLAYGPIAGLILTVIVSAIQAMTVSAQSGIQGFLMHVIATGAMVIMVGNVYKRSKKTLKAMIISLALGAIVMVIAMVGANLLITPWHMGVDISVVKAMLIPVIIPFNLLKAIVNCVLAFILAKALERSGVFKEME